MMPKKIGIFSLHCHLENNIDFREEKKDEIVLEGPLVKNAHRKCFIEYLKCIMNNKLRKCLMNNENVLMNTIEI